MFALAFWNQKMTNHIAKPSPLRFSEGCIFECSYRMLADVIAQCPPGSCTACHSSSLHHLLLLAPKHILLSLSFHSAWLPLAKTEDLSEMYSVVSFSTHDQCLLRVNNMLTTPTWTLQKQFLDLLWETRTSLSPHKECYCAGLHHFSPVKSPLSLV